MLLKGFAGKMPYYRNKQNKSSSTRSLMKSFLGTKNFSTNKQKWIAQDRVQLHRITRKKPTFMQN